MGISLQRDDVVLLDELTKLVRLRAHYFYKSLLLFANSVDDAWHLCLFESEHSATLLPMPAHGLH
jgi:hypothetical protein